MTLFLTGINHRTAGVALREALAIPPQVCPAALRDLRAGGLLREAAILSTCNRLELYTTTEDPSVAAPHLIDVLSHHSGLDPALFAPSLYQRTDRDAATHLFQVTAGIDSMILGESEILAQVKQAYLLAQAEGAVGPALHRLFQKALHSAKLVRAQTGIGAGQASIGAVVLALLQEQLGERLPSCEVLIWGAGKAAEVTARHVITGGVRRLRIVNRTPAKAQDLAAQCRGEWLSWEHALAALAQVDVAVICTQAPHYVLSAEEGDRLLSRRDGKPLVLIDLAVPRNVDPAIKDRPGIHLYNIDDLEQMAQQGRAQRAQALAACAAIITRQVTHYWQRESLPSPYKEVVAC